MTNQTRIYTWVRLSSDKCKHDLLVRVEPGNDDPEAIDQRLGDLVRIYLNTLLYEECRHEHNMAFNGVSKLQPVGRELIESPGNQVLEVWAAPTSVEGSTHQLGTAADQPSFWAAFAQQASDELKARVTRPAESLTVLLLS